MSLEKIRLENLKKNADLFASFSFDKFKEQIRPKKRVSIAGSVVKKKTPIRKGPARRSLRIANAPPISMNEDQLEKLMEKENLEVLRRPVTLGRISLSESLMEAGESQTEDYVSHTVFGSVSPSSTWDTYRSNESLTSFIEKLKTETRMSETSVGKVTPKRVSSLSFHPSADKALLMVGATEGTIGFWDITERELPSVMMQHHGGVVSMIKSHPSVPNRVVTTSYDGSMCVIDIKEKKVWEARTSIDDVRLMSMDFLSSHAVICGAVDGYASVTDFRQQHNSNRVHLKCFPEGKKHSVRSISVHPTDQKTLIATGTNGGYILLWDIRNPKKFLRSVPQERTCQWCEFSPNTGSRLLSSTTADKISIFDTDSMLTTGKPSTVVKHNNNTGRFLSPFRPRWLPNREDCFVVGSLYYPREAEIFNALNGSKLASMTDPGLSSVNSLWVYHPTQNILAGGNSSGRISYFFPVRPVDEESLQIKEEDP